MRTERIAPRAESRRRFPSHPFPVYRRSLLPLLLTGTFLTACKEPPTEPPPDDGVSEVVVTPSAESVYGADVTRQFEAFARDENGDPIPGATFAWATSNSNVATVDDDGLVTTRGEGSATISAEHGGRTGTATMEVQVVVYEQIDPYLATPAEGHEWEVPVVILRYLPTADGINLDVTKAPDFWNLGEISLDELKARIDAFDLDVKFGLEEGSRFRGYHPVLVDGSHAPARGGPSARGPQARAATPPSLGYRVVEYITVYEHMPAGEVLKQVEGYDVYLPDYAAMFDRLDMQEYVEDEGVKEIWFWHTGFDASFPSFDPAIHDPADFRGGWESNMASPTTGDISNSDRSETDLPVYNSTYVLYGQNYRRSQAEALHNHGHQLEAILGHVNQLQDGNTELFWRDFVGQDDAGQFITGRAGWTHMPPNTTEGYDYDNPTLVWSDIEDWIPDNSGAKKQVNVDTWTGIDYDWPGGADIPQREQSHWLVYWWQSMPGLDNAIYEGSRHMTNWWAFTGDWDGSIAAGMGLYEGVPTEHITVLNTVGEEGEFLSIHIEHIPGTHRSVYHGETVEVPLLPPGRTEATLHLYECIWNGQDYDCGDDLYPVEADGAYQIVEDPSGVPFDITLEPLNP